MSWEQRYEAKRATAADAVARIPRGKQIFVGSGAAEPVGLVEALVAAHGRFADNTIVHLLTLGPAPYVDEAYADQFRHNAFFIGPNVRGAVWAGRADYTPVFLSQIPRLIRSRRLRVDVALIQTTPPDRFGYVNLGVSVDIVLAAVQAADLVMAEINPRMPVIHGDGFLPMDRIDAWVLRESELPEVAPEPLDDTAVEIGKNVAGLVEDGSTLQLGIGQLPDAVLAQLTHRQDLGVWTEMFSDGVIDLIENGNITNRHKVMDPMKVSSSFTFGTRRTYDFVDRNPGFAFHPSDFINDPTRIARQHKMVAVNSALQIDLTGQVCADSIGTKFYSGIGGQVDFIRGASMCPAGKPIIAIRSTAKAGQLSRIVANLDEGAGVVTSRGDVRYVVTEYGVADLEGKSIRERAMALIAIAHPDFRGELLTAAKRRRYVFADQIAPRALLHRDYRAEVTLRDGAPVLLRPLEVTDERKMSDMFYGLSEQTVYRRWMTPVRRMPHRELQRYLDVDDTDNIAIVCEVTPPDAEPEIVGVGRYHVDSATRFAEVAFVIRDDWQGRGLGTALFRHMLGLARRNGVAGFTASVLADNHAMMRLFHQSGLKIESSLEDGTYELVMPFS